MNEGRHFGSSAHGAMIARPGRGCPPERKLVSRRSPVAQFRSFQIAIRSEILTIRSEEKYSRTRFSFQIMIPQTINW